MLLEKVDKTRRDKKRPGACMTNLKTMKAFKNFTRKGKKIQRVSVKKKKVRLLIEYFYDYCHYINYLIKSLKTFK